MAGFSCLGFHGLALPDTNKHHTSWHDNNYRPHPWPLPLRSGETTFAGRRVRQCLAESPMEDCAQTFFLPSKGTLCAAFPRPQGEGSEVGSVSFLRRLLSPGHPALRCVLLALFRFALKVRQVEPFSPDTNDNEAPFTLQEALLLTVSGLTSVC